MTATLPTTNPEPAPGLVVALPALPTCDFCPGEAHYDFRTRFGPWAYGCEQHYLDNRAHDELGVGHGQRLIVRQS